MASQIIENTKKILSRIEIAKTRVGRKDTVTLVAVSKKQSVDKINEYLEFARNAGVAPIIGENYLQEFQDKSSQIKGPYQVHFIGRLQSNKVKEVVSLFSVIESVHSEELLKKINKEAASIGKIQKVLLQVNVSNDPAKSGFAIERVEAGIQAAKQLPSIELLGLMTITELYEDPELARPDFAKLKSLRDSLIASKTSRYLSMGMSQDFEQAIEEGATHVRIGSSVFGARG